MKIGILTRSTAADSRIPALFCDAGALWIVDADDGGTAALYPREGRTDADLCRLVLAHDCEAVLCGLLEEAPFTVLADEGGVTRYRAAGLTAAEALLAMQRDALPLIPDHIGGSGCGAHGAQGGCREGHGDGA